MGEAVFYPIAKGETDLPNRAGRGINIRQLRPQNGQPQHRRVRSAQDQGRASGSDTSMGNGHHRSILRAILLPKLPTQPGKKPQTIPILRLL